MINSEYDNRRPGETRKGNWMQTSRGAMFWPLDPRADEVFIEDIAAGLSKLCRFAGQCQRFYSVAEHSVLVSQIVPPQYALIGLLHDATEAYVVDVPRPIKPFLGGYKDIEIGVWRAISERYGLPLDPPPSIKEADNAMVLAEADQIMLPLPAPWSIPGSPAAVKIECWSPDEAERRFLDRFHELTRRCVLSASAVIEQGIGE